MRILHTSDWHLGKILYEFSLIEDQRHMLEQIISIIDISAIDAVIIAGDVYDRSVPPAEAMRLYDDFLTKICVERKIPVLAISGNHDSPQRLEFGQKMYNASGYYIAGIPQKEILRVILNDSFGEVVFWLMPYTTPAEGRVLFKDAKIKTSADMYAKLLQEDINKLDLSRRNIGVLHGFFANSPENMLQSDSELNIGGVDIVPTSLFSEFNYLAAGHLHIRQGGGTGTIHYCGSPLKYSLSEQQEKSVTIIDMNKNGEVSTQICPLTPLRDVRIVKGHMRDLLDLSYHQNKNFNDYVFAQIESEPEAYSMEKLRHVFPNMLGLINLSELSRGELNMHNHAASAKLSAEDLFYSFYKQVKGEDIPENYKDIISQLCKNPLNNEDSKV